MTCPNGWWYGSEHIKKIIVANSVLLNLLGPQREATDWLVHRQILHGSTVSTFTASTALSWPITLVWNGDPYLSNIRYQLHHLRDTQNTRHPFYRFNTSLIVAVTLYSLPCNYNFLFKFFDSAFAFNCAAIPLAAASSCLVFLLLISCSTAWTSVTGCWAASNNYTSTKSVALSGKLRCLNVLGSE